MKFLIDENLSPHLCNYLTVLGDSAEHVHDSVGAGATDQEVIAYAEKNGAVVITADTDFGTLLAQSKNATPSVVLMRELLSLSVVQQGQRLSANIDQVRDALAKGAIVVFSLTGLRVRPLPL